ncbi:MAG: HIRAN domain-containing protein [Nitriliruptor sp.]|uniref:HIRAN domain-containing protein n=1 Tax=Nitriliruptor sp. TaxID=2448056 RepID=UPI0034A0769F
MTSTSRLDPSGPAARRLRRSVPADVLVFHTPVRGHAFAARPPGVPAPASGAGARLVREPDNPRDGLAVAVWAEGPQPWRVGYLDRAVAARLGPRLDAGQRFEVQVDRWIDAPGGTWRRPLLRIAPIERTTDQVPPGSDQRRPPGVRRRVVRPAR